MVERYALEHAPSSDEESSDMQGPAPEEELFICSGPWNALHSPTRSSCLEFEILYAGARICFATSMRSRPGPLSGHNSDARPSLCLPSQGMHHRTRGTARIKLQHATCLSGPQVGLLIPRSAQAEEIQAAPHCLQSH